MMGTTSKIPPAVPKIQRFSHRRQKNGEHPQSEAPREEILKIINTAQDFRGGTIHYFSTRHVSAITLGLIAKSGLRGIGKVITHCLVG
jgi:hypothetical protein